MDFKQTAIAILKTLDQQKFNEIRDKYIDDIYRRFYRYLDLPVTIRVALNDYERMKEDREGLDILDLGCCAGYFTYVCKYFKQNAIGIDNEDNEAYTKIAELMGIDRRVYEIKPFTFMPDFGKKFDIITGFGITFDREWTAKEWAFLIEDLLKNQLKKTGKIVLTLKTTIRNPEIKEMLEKAGALIKGNKVLIEKFNGKGKVSYWDWEGCHLCKSKNNEEFYRDGHYWYRCLDCWTVYQKMVFPRGKAFLNIPQTKRSKEEYFINRIKQDIISLGVDDKEVIDVGCGTGWLSEILRDNAHCKRIVATDLPNREISEIEGIEIVNADFELTGIPEELKGKFDLVICWQVIEHVKRPDLWFDLMSQLLKPKGRLFLTYCSEKDAKKFSRTEWRYSSLKGIEIVSEKYFEILTPRPLSVLMQKI